MKLIHFIGFCSAGSLIWSTLLVGSGYVLRANYTAVEHWLSPVGAGLLGVVVLVYFIRLVRRN